MENDLTKLETHFKFGQNWQEYVDLVGQSDIQRGVESLKRLLEKDEISNKSFFDIGCGSGMSILSALSLGAISCKGVDIDPSSIEAAKQLLSKYAENLEWQVSQGSVFDLELGDVGTYDIVHSWGVLHHTGDMWRAIEAASKYTKPGGKFVLAIYRKSLFCSLWKIEKFIYSKSTDYVQKVFREIYKLFYFSGLIATGRSPAKYLSNYHLDRGMDWHIDLHDWMGGYPYESASSSEIIDYLEKLGFKIYRQNTHVPYLGGLFGTHCDEFVFERQT
jgi:2-polyprenyl-3-methyl-5-hydroxy-6-metoxy-1,4-benzoquinol methylase